MPELWDLYLQQWPGAVRGQLALLLACLLSLWWCVPRETGHPTVVWGLILCPPSLCGALHCKCNRCKKRPFINRKSCFLFVSPVFQTCLICISISFFFLPRWKANLIEKVVLMITTPLLFYFQLAAHASSPIFCSNRKLYDVPNYPVIACAELPPER